MPPSLYEMKRKVLEPRTRRRRRRMELDGIGRTMYELHYYATPFHRFMGASLDNPGLLTDAALDATSVVVDAGAFQGDWSEQIVQRYGCRVHAYEPAPWAVEQLEARFGDVPSVSIEACALGGADGRAELALAGPGSSFHTGEAAWGTVEVEVRDVARVLAALGVDEIDLLKLNIEGSEFDVIDRLRSSGWLARVRQVSVQFHEWHPQAYRRRSRARRTLRDTHEEVWGYPWVWEFWRRRPPP